MNRNRGRAIVLGGSIAGLFAARVLSEHFREVLVVDRDQVLGVSDPRRGAPHTVHAHGLHARGHLIVEEFFPGITDELRADGIPTGDLAEMRWYFNARKLMPARTGLVSVTAPRPVLEGYIRGKVADIPNVTFLERHDILEPVASPDRERVIGVRVRPRGAGGGAGAGGDDAVRVLEADLVIDATGRGSRLPAWLEELGYRRPDEDRIKVGLAYTTRHYRKRPEMFDGVQSINPVASPKHPRGAFFGQVGPDKCILSLTGILGDHPPTDPEGFLQFTRTLPVPDVYEAVRDAEPLDDPVRFGFPASVRRRYEKLSRLPAGLLPMGDALCSFNPVYGQGMSVAAMEARALRQWLREGGTSHPAELLPELSKIIDVPWQISAGGDLDFPGVEGPRTLKVRMGNAYVARVQYAATKDAKVTDAYMRVAGMMERPESLMRPGTMLCVLWHALCRPQEGESWLAASAGDATPSGAAPPTPTRS